MLSAEAVQLYGGACETSYKVSKILASRAINPCNTLFSSSIMLALRLQRPYTWSVASSKSCSWSVKKIKDQYWKSNGSKVITARLLSTTGENSSDDNGASGSQMAKFLASRRAFLKDREKGEHLKSHAKGPGGRSGQQYNSKGQDDNNRNTNYYNNNRHYRKGKTVHKSQHVREGGFHGKSDHVPTRKGGRGKVARNKKGYGQRRTPPFDGGFLYSMGPGGKPQGMSRILESFYI